MTLAQIKSLRLTSLAPNQTIVRTVDQTIFMSYDSIIVVLDGSKTYLGKNWRYSKTTSKYRNQFLNETTPETQAKLDNGTYLPLGD